MVAAKTNQWIGGLVCWNYTASAYLTWLNWPSCCASQALFAPCLLPLASCVLPLLTESDLMLYHLFQWPGVLTSCCAQFSSSAKLEGEQTSWFSFKTAKSLHEQFLSFNQGIRNGMNIYCNSFIQPDQRWNTLNSMEYSSLPRPKTQEGFQHFYIELLSSCPLLLAASFVCRASSECCFPKGYASIL